MSYNNGDEIENIPSSKKNSILKHRTFANDPLLMRTTLYS